MNKEKHKSSLCVSNSIFISAIKFFFVSDFSELVMSSFCRVYNWVLIQPCKLCTLKLNLKKTTVKNSLCLNKNKMIGLPNKEKNTQVIK